MSDDTALVPAEAVLCSCGCGEAVRRGRQYRRGHWARTRKAREALSERRWRGLPSEHGDGYLTIKEAPFTPNRLAHVVVAERALGRPLPVAAVVHHVDGVRSNNDPANLVICQDQAYHLLLHRRQRAHEACGQPDWLRCSLCKQWDAPERLYIAPGANLGRHRACHRAYVQRRKQR